MFAMSLPRTMSTARAEYVEMLGVLLRRCLKRLMRERFALRTHRHGHAFQLCTLQQFQLRRFHLLSHLTMPPAKRKRPIRAAPDQVTLPRLLSAVDDDDGSADDVAEIIEQMTAGAQCGAGNADEPSSSTTPVRRGPGRPRKDAVPEPDVFDDSYDDVDC